MQLWCKIIIGLMRIFLPRDVLIHFADYSDRDSCSPIRIPGQEVHLFVERQISSIKIIQGKADVKVFWLGQEDQKVG